MLCSAAATASEHVHGGSDDEPPPTRGRYRPWAELLKRTFAFDVLSCGRCGGRLRLIALVTEAPSITRYLHAGDLDAA